MSLREQQATGARARLELEQTEAAFIGLRAAMMEAVVKCHPSETRKLDRLIASVQVMDAVRKSLLQVAAGESVATAMLEINPEL